MLVLAADHVIEDVEAFQASIEQARVLAESGKMVTFGVVATGPETGYGYVRSGAEITIASKQGNELETKSVTYEVSEFVEKPNLETAQSYVDGGQHYWNSGMFKASRYLEVLKSFRPDIHAACLESMQGQAVDNDFVRVDVDAFTACPDESIDYAVMEPLFKQANGDVVVVPLDAGWNDIGGYSALWQISDQDNNGNVLNGDVKAVATKNSLIMGEDRLISTVGVEDLVIVDTKDAILVAHKDKAQEVKAIVAQLKAEGRSERLLSTERFTALGVNMIL